MLLTLLKQLNKEECLRKRRDRDRARGAANTAEQTSEINEQRRLGLEQETEQQREVRLEGMCTRRRGQLAVETNEERDIILETMSTHRREHLATESAEERESRLQQMREHDHLAQETVQERLPSFQL